MIDYLEINMANRNLASKGRYGDTEIRNVAGRKSHVSKQEANLVDLYGMLGEYLVQRGGAGTRNPRTGMPEYHDYVQEHYHTIPGNDLSGVVYAQDGEVSPTPANELDPAEEFDRDAYMAAADKDAYLLGIGVPGDRLEYFQSNINEAYLDDPITGEGGFLTQAKELTEAGATLAETTATETYDIGVSGVEEKFRAGEEAYRIGGLGIAEGRRAAGAQFELGMEQAGTMAGRSLYAAKEQGDVVAAKSGFARSGAQTAATKRAQGGIFQDYKTQSKSLAEARGSAMTGLGIQQQGLESDWAGTQAQYGEGGIAMRGLETDLSSVMGYGTKGEEGYVAGSADITRTGADLTYQTGVSDIGQSAEEEFWKNLRTVEQFS